MILAQDPPRLQRKGHRPLAVVDTSTTMSSGRLAVLANPRWLLFLPVAADMVWLYANAPADRQVNPFFLYLVVFGVGVLLLSYFLVPSAIRLAHRIGPRFVFAGAGLVLSVVEEVVAFLTRSGIFQDGRHTLLFGLVQAALPLFLWTLGVLLVVHRFSYSAIQLYLLAGLSGWLCEAVIGGFLFREPAVAVLALPAIAYSYFVLIYLPYRSIEGYLQPRGASGWRVPGLLAIPTLLWVVGGVAGSLIARSAGIQ
jgi:hypothetical protein